MAKEPRGRFTPGRGFCYRSGMETCGPPSPITRSRPKATGAIRWRRRAFSGKRTAGRRGLVSQRENTATESETALRDLGKDCHSEFREMVIEGRIDKYAHCASFYRHQHPKTRLRDLCPA